MSFLFHWLDMLVPSRVFREFQITIHQISRQSVGMKSFRLFPWESWLSFSRSGRAVLHIQMIVAPLQNRITTSRSTIQWLESANQLHGSESNYRTHHHQHQQHYPAPTRPPIPRTTHHPPLVDSVPLYKRNNFSKRSRPCRPDLQKEAFLPSRRCETWWTQRHMFWSLAIRLQAVFTHNQTPISALVHGCAVACLGFVVWVISNKAKTVSSKWFFSNPFQHDLTFQGELKKNPVLVIVKVSRLTAIPRAQTTWTGLMGHKIRARSVKRARAQDTLQLSFRGYSLIFMDIHGYSPYQAVLDYVYQQHHNKDQLDMIQKYPKTSRAPNVVSWYSDHGFSI